MAQGTACKARRRLGGSARVLVSGLAICVAGCASPGQPRPPSLHLPRVADDLTAERVGDHVHLRWTTPTETTDGPPVQAEMTAVVCREGGAVGTASRRVCAEVMRVPVHPGPTEAEDALGGEAAGAPRLLAYRVELLNAARRSAGRSTEAFAAGGVAPPAVEGLTATPVRRGVRLGWRAGDEGSEIDLDRVNEGAVTARGEQRRKTPEISLPSQQPRAKARLRGKAAGERDAGGTIDRSVEKGATYTYRAQRVQQVTVEGHELELRSEPSTAVRVKVVATFPPMAPGMLEAAAGGAGATSIDLSWKPGEEVDLAGYNVYRSELSGAGVPARWERLNSQPVAIPAFTDTNVRPGGRYAYRVCAVDADGNESAPGNVVEEMAPTG